MAEEAEAMGPNLTGCCGGILYRGRRWYGLSRVHKDVLLGMKSIAAFSEVWKGVAGKKVKGKTG